MWQLSSTALAILQSNLAEQAERGIPLQQVQASDSYAQMLAQIAGLPASMKERE